VRRGRDTGSRCGSGFQRVRSRKFTELPDASKAMTLAATRGVFDQFSPDLSISL
jgi:hypothetical protein